MRSRALFAVLAVCSLAGGAAAQGPGRAVPKPAPQVPKTLALRSGPTRHPLFTPEDRARVKVTHPFLTPEVRARFKTQHPFLTPDIERKVVKLAPHRTLPAPKK